MDGLSRCSEVYPQHTDTFVACRFRVMLDITLLAQCRFDPFGSQSANFGSSGPYTPQPKKMKTWLQSPEFFCLPEISQGYFLNTWLS